MVSSGLVAISHHQIHQLAQGERSWVLENHGLAFPFFQTGGVFSFIGVRLLLFTLKNNKSSLPRSDCTHGKDLGVSGHLES